MSSGFLVPSRGSEEVSSLASVDCQQSLVIFDLGTHHSNSTSDFIKPFLCVSVSQVSLCLSPIRTPAVGFRAHFKSWIILFQDSQLITSAKTVFPNKVMFTGSELGPPNSTSIYILCCAILSHSVLSNSLRPHGL